ncbi:MAG: hypothetical protein Q9191_000541, partial [Dirinaria sp. TL-2023a]
GRYFDHATLPSLPTFLNTSFRKLPSVEPVPDGARLDEDGIDDSQKPRTASIGQEIGPLRWEKTQAEPATATVNSPDRKTPAIADEVEDERASPPGSKEEQRGRSVSGLEAPGELSVSANLGLSNENEGPVAGEESHTTGRNVISSPTGLPLSSDVVSALSKSTSETINAAQSPASPRVVNLPPKDFEGQGSKSLEGSQWVANEENEKETHPRDTQKAASVGAAANVSAKDDDLETQSARTPGDTNMQSQMNVVKSDAIFVGTPATPDEQLRLEQAQALQLSQFSSAGPELDETPLRGSTSASAGLGLESANLPKYTDYPIDGSTTSLVAMAERGDNNAENQHFEPDTAGLREHAFPGMNKSLSKDLTFSRRPPMRIDTSGHSKNDSIRSPQPNQKITPTGTTPFTPAESATTSKSGPATSQVNSPPERMTTRVSSGALRHKSVSEILGEVPKHANVQSDKATSEKAIHDSSRDTTLQSPRSAASVSSPESAAFKQRLSELKERERSKLSTVVFARQQHTNVQRYGDLGTAQHDEVDEERAEPKLYFLPLFAAQVTKPTISQSLHALVGSAHKTLSTADQYTDFQDQQDCWILSKIHHLQSANRWSLRQHERSVEATRPKAHWDVLLNHVKWMRTDFREERKWKLAAAKSLADACAHWVASPLEVRNLLQVKIRFERPRGGSGSTAGETPELIASAEDDSDATDFESSDLETTKRGAPGSIFSLPPDMFVFGLERTPVAEKILSELPLYQPSVRVQDALLNRTPEGTREDWRTPIVPLSKFAEGKLVTQAPESPRKRSRYDYSSERENPQPLAGHSSQDLETDMDGLGPEQDDVALFRSENKHIRDRIHSGHAFRPPSEYPMPSQSFFESRQSSQWTQGEDDSLRRLVREYAYNWLLISSCLSSASRFSSGAERRTPWECFERWIGLEGLPAEMSKTQYFKEYHSRLQAAQRNHEAHQQALQQQQNNAGQVPLRRRTTMPFLVERRKNNKHLHLVDAMRKLAKKRETALSKQQHVAGLAAMRKQNEAVQTKATMHTPQEFSRFKYEREQKMQENARLYHQQFVQQQREKAKNQRPGGPGNGQNMMPLGASYPSSATGSSPNVAPALPNGHGQGGQMGQMRQMPSITRLPNGAQVPSTLPTTTHGVPHAPMQPQISVQQRIPAQMIPDSQRIIQEAARLQDQQRRYLAAQTQHQHPHPQSNGQVGNPTSPPNMSHLNALNHHNNASLYGGLQGRSGSPAINGGTGTAGSNSPPRINNPSQPQPLSSGMVPVVNQMQNQIKARHPQASPEQVKAMTTESLHQYHISQAAMQAAAGNPNVIGLPSHNGLNGLSSQSQQQAMMNGVNASPMMTPNTAQYAALMRSQQAQQSRNASAGGMSAPRPASRSVTPGHAPSQSPRPSQAQMAGGQ